MAQKLECLICKRLSGLGHQLSGGMPGGCVLRCADLGSLQLSSDGDWQQAGLGHFSLSQRSKLTKAVLTIADLAERTALKLVTLIHWGQITVAHLHNDITGTRYFKQQIQPAIDSIMEKSNGDLFSRGHIKLEVGHRLVMQQGVDATEFLKGDFSPKSLLDWVQAEQFRQGKRDEATAAAKAAASNANAAASKRRHQRAAAATGTAASQPHAPAANAVVAPAFDVQSAVGNMQPAGLMPQGMVFNPAPVLLQQPMQQVVAGHYATQLGFYPQVGMHPAVIVAAGLTPAQQQIVAAQAVQQAAAQTQFVANQQAAAAAGQVLGNSSSLGIANSQEQFGQGAHQQLQPQVDVMPPAAAAASTAVAGSTQLGRSSAAHGPGILSRLSTHAGTCDLERQRTAAGGGFHGSRRPHSKPRSPSPAASNHHRHRSPDRRRAEPREQLRSDKQCRELQSPPTGRTDMSPQLAGRLGLVATRGLQPPVQPHRQRQRSRSRERYPPADRLHNSFDSHRVDDQRGVSLYNSGYQGRGPYESGVIDEYDREGHNHNRPRGWQYGKGYRDNRECRADAERQFHEAAEFARRAEAAAAEAAWFRLQQQPHRGRAPHCGRGMPHNNVSRDRGPPPPPPHGSRNGGRHSRDSQQQPAHVHQSQDRSTTGKQHTKRLKSVVAASAAQDGKAATGKAAKSAAAVAANSVVTL